MHRLGALAKYRLLLTGTPVTNKAIDIFSQYKFLDPRIFGQSFLQLQKPLLFHDRLRQPYTRFEKEYGG